MLRGACSLLILPLLAGNTTASVGADDFLITGTGSYAMGELKQTGQTIDGNAFALTIESIGWEAPVSFGLSFAYAYFVSEDNAGGLVQKQVVKSYPIYLMGRYWFGTGAIQGYLGGAFGVYFSQLETTTISNNQYTSFGMSGTGLSVPVGFILSLSQRVFVNFNYTLNWLIDNDYLTNGIVNSVGLGIGINFGD